MKKLCYSAFVAFRSSIATILALQALAQQPIAPTDTASKTYSLAEVAGHAVENDCWMAIDNKVYDLSAYLPKHPAGPAIMANWCGKEASEGMHTKGFGSEHSDFAYTLLKNYVIGELK